MKTTDFTGWKKVFGYSVYFENGTAKRSVKKSVTGCGLDAAQIWIPSRLGGWDSVSYLTESALRSRLARGTAKIF